jgi:hypothetical protein
MNQLKINPKYIKKLKNVQGTNAISAEDVDAYFSSLLNDQSKIKPLRGRATKLPE